MGAVANRESELPECRCHVCALTVGTDDFLATCYPVLATAQSLVLGGMRCEQARQAENLLPEAAKRLQPRNRGARQWAEQ